MAKGKKKSAAKVRANIGRKASKKNKSTGPKHIPWDKAEVRYVTAEWPDVVTYEDIAKEYDVGVRVVQKEGSKRKWPDKRSKWLKDGTEELLNLASKEVGRFKLEQLKKVKKLLKIGEEFVKVNPRAWKAKDMIEYLKYQLVLLGEPDVTVGGSIDLNLAKEQLQELVRKGIVKRDALRSNPGRRK